jgi:hypothetical protein
MGMITSTININKSKKKDLLEAKFIYERSNSRN